MGHSGNILVATNEAGRGTDIIIDENSKKNCGLYVIVGFFPENSRVEFQAIGRAGRQGNPGKAKMIISNNEEFIYLNYNKILKHLKKGKKGIEAYYSFREENVEIISKTRIEFVKKERIYFHTLKKFFLLKDFIIFAFNNNILKFIYEYINFYIENSVSYEYYKNFTLMNLDNIWSEFYSKFISDGNNNIILHGEKDYFKDFMEKFENEWPDYLKEIFNNEKIIKIDIMAFVMKNLKNEFNDENIINSGEVYKTFNEMINNIIKKYENS